MSSWFSFEKLNELSSEISNKVQSASNKVQSALPIDDELIRKLTLTSADLVAEHSQLEQEELRKEEVRDCLTELLPFETLDEEREILVDECREAILKLSTEKDTFRYPFTASEGVELFKKTTHETNESVTNLTKVRKEAEEKLTKLQPLPPLLENFDLDTHVGLIQRVFELDPNLVDTHSQLTGAGEKEQIFWKNYFFHCAYTRFEQGLSIDEIWANKSKLIADEDRECTITTVTSSINEQDEIQSDESSTEMIFEPDPSSVEDPLPTTTASCENLTEKESQGSPSQGGHSSTLTTTSESESSASTDTKDITDSFDVVEHSLDTNVFDDELDDLEAEIARELED